MSTIKSKFIKRVDSNFIIILLLLTTCIGGQSIDVKSCCQNTENICMILILL